MNKQSNDLKPVLVVVTAETCGACNNLKRTIWPQMKEKILAENKVNLVDITLPNTNSPIGSEYPPELRNYVQWFPTFLLFTGKSWNEKKNLNGIIYGGEIDPNIGVARLSNGGKRITIQDISNWIDDFIKTRGFDRVVPYKPIVDDKPIILLTQNGKEYKKENFVPPTTIRYKPRII